MPSAWARGLITSRHRRALTRTAVNAVAAGFPVVPGAWWSADGRRFECDLADCARSGPHPAVRTAGRSAGPPDIDDGLVAHAVRHPEAVAARWNRRPYAVLVPTGETCDVVDVPVAFGRHLALRLDNRSALGPVIAAGSRWFFLTAPGGQPPALGSDILVHGRGSWIMLPPSLGPGGERSGWLVRPDRFGWVLPPRDEVIRALAPIPRSISRSGSRQASSAPV